MNFKCLQVKVLFNNGYWDGPTSGLCEYNGETLYFCNTNEIYFSFPETDKECIEMGESKDFYRLRIFTIYRLPPDQIDIIKFNHNLFETLKFNSDDLKSSYDSLRKPLIWEKDNNWKDISWQWAIGYTTEDVWDSKDYYTKRYQELDRKLK